MAELNKKIHSGMAAKERLKNNFNEDGW